MNSNIEVLDHLDRDVFERDYLAVGKPVVLRGGARNWPAFQKWTPSYLASLFKEEDVLFQVSDVGLFSYEEEPVELNETMPFSEGFALISDPDAPRKCYLQQKHIPDQFPALVEDYRIPELIADPSKLETINLWFGSGGNFTNTHFDVSENFLVHLYGKKSVTLYHPDQLEMLYPKLAPPHINWSKAIFRDPDYERFPLLRQAHGHTATLEAGDLLFLPSFWWHHVTSHSVGISINFWWNSHLNRTLNPTAQRLMPIAYAGGQLGSLLKDTDISGISKQKADEALPEIASYLLEREYPMAAALVALTAVEAALQKNMEEAGQAVDFEANPMERLTALAAQARRAGLTAPDQQTCAIWQDLLGRIFSQAEISTAEVRALIESISSYNAIVLT